jgi:hypothetical protein
MRPDDVATAVFSPAQFGRLAGLAYLALGYPERAPSPPGRPPLRRALGYRVPQIQAAAVTARVMSQA